MRAWFELQTAKAVFWVGEQVTRVSARAALPFWSLGAKLLQAKDRRAHQARLAEFWRNHVRRGGAVPKEVVRKFKLDREFIFQNAGDGRVRIVCPEGV